MSESFAWEELPANFFPHEIWVELDNRNAFSAYPGINHKALIISQKLASGTAAHGEKIRIFNEDQGDALFGAGSLASRQISQFKRNNRFTELHCIGLDDKGTGVAASGAFVFAGSVAKAGTLNFYIGGERVRIGVLPTHTPADIASALAAELAANHPRLPVTGAAASDRCNLTYRHKGEVGNYLDLRMNYYGETPVAGLSVTVESMQGGTGNPDLQDGFDVKGDEKFHHIITPWTDASNLAVADAEMARVADPTIDSMGRIYMGLSQTAGALATTGAGRNSQFMSLMGIYNSPTPPELTGTAMGALVAFHGNNHAARPFQLLRMKGVLPPPTLDRFTKTTKNTLMIGGINTPIYGPGGFVYLDQLVTCYQKNENNIADASYRWVNVLLILDHISDRFKQVMSRQYKRSLLAEDGTEVDPGVPLATPRRVKGTAIAMFEALEREGMVQQVDTWKDEIRVAIDAQNHTRIGLVMPPKLMSQLVQIYGRIEFVLN